MDSTTEEQPATEAEYVESWDEYFLHIAEAVSRKSKDPRCRVGAVIVSEDGVLLSTGFNGLARGVYDHDDVLANADEKLKWICHAEMNAIYNAARVGVGLKSSTIYVTKFPCMACCNAVIQAGVRRVYTHDDKFWGDDPLDPSHERKRVALHQARIEVSAPFHPAYTPAQQIGGRRARKPPRSAPRPAENTVKGAAGS